MSIKKRELEILLELKNNKHNLNYLCKLFETSERNLRYQIDNLNYYLKKINYNIIQKIDKTYFVNLSDSEFSFFISYYEKNDYIFSSEEREEYILYQLLIKKNISSKNLENFLGVSRGTIKKDVLSLIKRVSIYELNIIRDNGVFTLTGKEKKLRHLYMIFILNYSEKKKFMFPLNSFLYHEININKTTINTKEIILNLEKKINLNFIPEFIPIMQVYLEITFKRIKDGYIINKKNNFEFIKSTVYYNFVQEELSSIIDPILIYEIAHLTEYFISGLEKSDSFEKKSEIKKFIDDLFEKIEIKNSTSLNINILENNIENYLSTAIYRIKNNYHLNNTNIISSHSNLKKIIEEYSRDKEILNEKLREEDIIIIYKLIETEIENSKKRVISLTKLIECIEQNSNNINLENLIQSLKNEFSEFIIWDELNLKY